MTKKDYKIFAEMIKERLDYNDKFDPDEATKACVDELTAIANKMAVIFQIDNPRFHKIKFLTACGVISGTK